MWDAAKAMLRGTFIALKWKRWNVSINNQNSYFMKIKKEEQNKFKASRGKEKNVLNKEQKINKTEKLGKNHWKQSLVLQKHQ